jgi:hypothetical protein
MRLSGVSQDRHRALLHQKLPHSLHRFQIFIVWIGNRRLTHRRRGLFHLVINFRVLIDHPRWRKRARFLRNYNGALQLSREPGELFRLLRIEVHYRPLHRSFRTRRPCRRGNRQRVPHRRNHARLRCPSHPPMLNRIPLQMHIRKPIFLEHLHGPVAGLLQQRRSRKPRPDAVRQILQIVHQLAMFPNLRQYPRIRTGRRIRILHRSLRYPGASHDNGCDHHRHN